MATFTAEVFQNEYLPDGATEVNAVVTVTSSGHRTGVVPAWLRRSVAEIDHHRLVSGSMDMPSAPRWSPPAALPTWPRSTRSSTARCSRCSPATPAPSWCIHARGRW
jgi:hypothetical protein